MNEKEKSKAVMEYKAQSGDIIRIDPQMVRDFLIQGKRELVTVQEIFYFMHMCKARKLNPFVKDCYLIKYGIEPAAIVTSVDYFRKNARKADDCKGWKCGVIVIANKELIEREGSLVLDHETLVGGWALARPNGWYSEKRHTVNLAPYIKKTKDGRVTRFWAEERQPDMIMKVAETQLLRQIWGEESTGMYTPEEMPSMEDIQPGPMASTEMQLDIVKRLKPETKPEPEDQDKRPAEWERTKSALKNNQPEPQDDLVEAVNKAMSLPDEQVEPATDGIPPEWEREVWARKKSSGFSTHVWTHIRTLPQLLEAEVRAKWFKLYGKEGVLFPSDQPGNKVSVVAPPVEDESTIAVYHDPEDFGTMALPIQNVYLELADLNSCDICEVDPTHVNQVLKTKHYKVWEAVRIELNYGMMVTTTAAANVWNDAIGLKLTGLDI